MVFVELNIWYPFLQKKTVITSKSNKSFVHMGQGNTSLKFDVLFWGLLSIKGFIFVKKSEKYALGDTIHFLIS